MSELMTCRKCKTDFHASDIVDFTRHQQGQCVADALRARAEKAEAERDRMHAINAMLGHWYEDAYELLKKAGIPDDIESPLGDLADDISSHLRVWYSAEDFKSVRIYKQMEAERDQLRARIEGPAAVGIPDVVDASEIRARLTAERDRYPARRCVSASSGRLTTE